jgi:hypothetical protein
VVAVLAATAPSEAATAVSVADMVVLSLAAFGVVAHSASLVLGLPAHGLHGMFLPASFPPNARINKHTGGVVTSARAQTGRAGLPAHGARPLTGPLGPAALQA